MVPAFAKTFAGPWRIAEMDTWDNDILHLVEEAHSTFQGASDGESGFVGERHWLLQQPAGGRELKAVSFGQW